MTTNGAPEQPQQPPVEETQSPAGLFGIPTTWLVIGGGGGGVVLLIVIVVVILLVSGVLGGGNPQPGSMLDLVPDDATSIIRFDVQRTLDSDLAAEEFELDDSPEFLDDLGMDIEDLDEMLFVDLDGNGFVVMKGSYDVELATEELEDNDFEDDVYRGYDIWIGQDGGAIALLDGYILLSWFSPDAVEGVLKILYNESGSLARAEEDNEMKLLLDKLGDGFAVIASTGSSCRVDRCEGWGIVAVDVDEDAEEATSKVVLLFRNERAAENAARDYDEVADFLEGEDIEIDDTEADGRFVVGEAIEDLGETSQLSEPVVPVASAMSRSDWMDECYFDSDSLDEAECACVYEYLDAMISGAARGAPIPDWDPDWEYGRFDNRTRLSEIGVEAVNWCA